MIRICKSGDEYYGEEIGSSISIKECGNIWMLVSQGNPIMIVESLYELKEFGVDIEVIMIKNK